jgi:hypothetical protein
VSPTLRLWGQPVICQLNESLRQRGRRTNVTNRIRRRLTVIVRCLYNVPMDSGWHMMLRLAGPSPDVMKILTVQSRLHALTVRWRSAEWKGMATKGRGLADLRVSTVVIRSSSLPVVCTCSAHAAVSQLLNFRLYRTATICIIGKSAHARVV